MCGDRDNSSIGRNLRGWPRPACEHLDPQGGSGAPGIIAPALSAWSPGSASTEGPPVFLRKEGQPTPGGSSLSMPARATAIPLTSSVAHRRSPGEAFRATTAQQGGGKPGPELRQARRRFYRSTARQPARPVIAAHCLSRLVWPKPEGATTSASDSNGRSRTTRRTPGPVGRAQRPAGAGTDMPLRSDEADLGRCAPPGAGAAWVHPAAGDRRVMPGRRCQPIVGVSAAHEREVRSRNVPAYTSSRSVGSPATWYGPSSTTWNCGRPGGYLAADRRDRHGGAVRADQAHRDARAGPPQGGRGRPRRIRPPGPS